MSQQDSLKQSKISIDSDEKLVAYNNFHDYARKLTEESIKINALAKQVNFNLCCIVRRRKILEAKKKCIDEFALNVYGEEGPKIFSSYWSDIVVDPSIPNLDLNSPSVSGSRTQYPIRLAYARYTRCKSQGQTMIKIVSDLGDTEHL